MALTMQCLFIIVLTSYNVYFVTSTDQNVDNMFAPSPSPEAVVSKPNGDVDINSFEPYTVQITNGNIDNLFVHIFSKDNDLGNKTLGISKSTSWSFRMNSPETTTFKGQFYWLNPDGTLFKEADFNVFDRQVAVECGQNLFKQNRCYWGVGDVGFIFAKGEPGNWKLKHTWN